MSDTEIETWGIDGSILLYGIFADVALLLPLILYLVLDDASSYAQYHQTYINMIYSAYAPLGISWFLVLVDDSNAARTSLKGAIEMAGLGPFALLWVGWATFCMSAKSANVLTFTNISLTIFAIIYPIVNIGLIVMHYHVSPPMYAWLEEAPMKPAAIDNATPWSKPVEAAAPVEAAPAADPVEAEVTVEAEVEVEAEAEVEEDSEEADEDADPEGDDVEDTFL